MILFLFSFSWILPVACLLPVKRELFQVSARVVKWKGNSLWLVYSYLHLPLTENQVIVHNLILALNNLEHVMLA